MTARGPRTPVQMGTGPRRWPKSGTASSSSFCTPATWGSPASGTPCWRRRAGSKGNGIGFVFVGDGALRASLEERAAGIGNVRFLPFYPGEQLPQVLASADLHVVTVRKGLEGLVVPSKLYPILMAGRPVLALSAAEADVARIVNEHGCGFVVDPDDPDAVAETVRSVRQRPEVLETMAQKARQASRLFDREHELKRFVGLVEAVAGAASTVSSPSGGS